MRFAVDALLELAPMSKILFSTDGHLYPETYFVAAKWGRRILGAALDHAVADGDLTAAEAERAGEAILRGNAHRLYQTTPPSPVREGQDAPRPG
jgi:predicted TIM-barrel fold metal-dependent hydrolase